MQTAIAFSPLVVTYLVRALGLRDEPVGYGIIGLVVGVLVVMWAAEPLMNLVLLATREGAILLDNDSKRAAYLFLGFAAAALACVVGAVLGAPGALYGLAIGYTLFAMGVGSSHHLVGNRRRLVHAAAFALPACGLVVIALAALRRGDRRERHDGPGRDRRHRLAVVRPLRLSGRLDALRGL